MNATTDRRDPKNDQPKERGDPLAVDLGLALMATPGVVSAGVNLTQSVADVAYQPQIVDFEGGKRTILEAGYGVAEPRGAGPEAGAEEEAEREREYRTLMRKFWFAAIVSVPVMLLRYPDLIPGLRDWMPMGSVERRIVWALLGVLAFRARLVGLAVLYRHVAGAEAPPTCTR